MELVCILYVGDSLYNNFVHNFQKLEAAKAPFSRWMDK